MYLRVSPIFFVFRFFDYHTLAHEMVKNTLNLYLYCFNMF